MAHLPGGKKWCIICPVPGLRDERASGNGRVRWVGATGRDSHKGVNQLTNSNYDRYE